MANSLDASAPLAPQREAAFQRNAQLEALMQELNVLLAEPERSVVARHDRPEHAVVFVLGAPRSGTTMTMQWLAATGAFGYPSNLMARFYAAPYIGTRIQQLITDPVYSFNDEFHDLNVPRDFSSNLGKTQGVLAPNEFWYFWRRFVPNNELRHLSPEEERQVDSIGLSSSLAAVEHALGRPLAMKAMILQYNVKVLSAAFRDRVVFLWLRRKPLYNAQSLLRARRRFYGSENVWYSGKPREFEWLQHLSPVEQVAGQVHYTDAAIGAGLGDLPSACVLEIDYESFCLDPEQYYDELRARLSDHGSVITETYSGPSRFENTNGIEFSPERHEEFREAWIRFGGDPNRV